ncbi:hypothetical protein BJ912DRAFT_962781, partial [Pholiota molesta]
MPKTPKLTTPRKSQRADDPAVASIRTSRHTMPKTQQVADLTMHCSVPRCPATFTVESAVANHMSITHSAPWAPDKNVHRRADPCNVPTCPAVFWSKAERIAHTKSRMSGMRVICCSLLRRSACGSFWTLMICINIYMNRTKTKNLHSNAGRARENMYHYRGCRLYAKHV